MRKRMPCEGSEPAFPVEVGLQQRVRALCVVLDGEYICQDFAFRAEDDAVVLVLGNVNSHANHDDTPSMFI